MNNLEMRALWMRALCLWCQLFAISSFVLRYFFKFFSYYFFQQPLFLNPYTIDCPVADDPCRCWRRPAKRMRVITGAAWESTRSNGCKDTVRFPRDFDGGWSFNHATSAKLEGLHRRRALRVLKSSSGGGNENGAGELHPCQQLRSA